MSYALELIALREQLGLTNHAMAQLLYTSPQTYASWERHSRPRPEAAARIRRFLTSANDQLEHLKSLGVEIGGLMPLNIAASTLGVPQETLFHAYRAGVFSATDLGILGTWVPKTELAAILAAVLE